MMQQLQPANDGPVSADGCARELLAGAPAAMRFIREHMRRNRQAELTVPHFRALLFVGHRADASLSEMAEHLGLSLPAASRMVDVLVQRRLLQRRPHSGDRRCVSLALTSRGQAVSRAAVQATRTALAQRFDTLSARDLALVSRAMRILSRVFAAENCRPPAARNGRRSTARGGLT